MFLEFTFGKKNIFFEKMSVEDRGVGVPANKQPNLAVGCRAPLPGSGQKGDCWRA